MMDIKLYHHIDAVPVDPGGSVVVLLTEDHACQIAPLLERLHDMDVHGAVVPGLIHGADVVGSGIAVITLCDLSFAFACPMNASESKLHGKLRRRGAQKSLIVAVDGLSPDMDRFVDNLNRCAGSMTILGVGAGYGDFRARPAVFDHSGLLADHALVLANRHAVQVAASHGWQSIYGPLVVTRAEKNIIHELNHQPAFAIYRDLLARHEGVDITPENFLEIAPSYPLGIGTFSDHEVIVRDPIAARPDSGLLIVSSVSEMDTLYIMKGDPDDLIASTAKLSAGALGHGGCRQALLFDSVSRIGFLNGRGAEEVGSILEAAANPELEFFGVTGIGEITNVGYDRTRILNKTILLGAVIDE